MDNRDKFTNKASNYAKYRPSYPKEFIDYLMDEVGMAGKIIADIGAGTGILTKLLADRAGRVIAIEPNKDMWDTCMEYCRILANFTALDGTAEDTGLPENSVDYITVAQAFHWFDRERTKTEFQRILKPNGKVTLVWNSRIAESEFIRENDELLRRVCPGFIGFSGGGSTELEQHAYADFFKDGLCEYRIFDNDRYLTLEEYTGGSLSASYAPLEGDPNYGEFIGGLKDLFEKYNSNGELLMPNKTYSYTGEV